MLLYTWSYTLKNNSQKKQQLVNEDLVLAKNPMLSDYFSKLCFQDYLKK